MPSLEERREVAARLRDFARTVRRVGYACVLKKCTHEEECDGFGIEGCEGCFNESLNRLADLIEPTERTCRMEVGQDFWVEYHCICSECGMPIDDEAVYCSKCGARVKEEA